MFLDVKRFPTISFVSGQVDDLGQGRLRVTGALTLRGITRIIALDAIVKRETSERTEIAARTTLDPRDFKVGPRAMGLVVGNEVAIRIGLVLRAS
jgi:polyisoprenoid-binding protein YceI